MRFNKKGWFIVGFLLATLTTGYALEEVIRKEVLKIGRGSAVDVTIEADTGAGVNNPKVKWDESESKWVLLDDTGAEQVLGGGAGGVSGVQMLDNGDFEAPVNLQNWTNTGSGSFVLEVDVADVGLGEQSAIWDAAAASDVLVSDAVTIPNAIKSRVCTMEFLYNGGDSNIKAQVYDGSNVIAEADLVAATQWQPFIMVFTCPSTGTLAARFEASADAAALTLDDVFVGQGRSSVNAGAPSYAQAYFDTDCNWSHAVGNAGLAPFGTSDNSCTLVIPLNKGIGPIAPKDTGTPGQNLPGIKFTPKAGKTYRLSATVQGRNGDLGNSNWQYGMTIDGGSTFLDKNGCRQISSASVYCSMPLEGLWTAPSAAEVTLEIYCNDESSTNCQINPNTGAPQNAVNFVIQELETSPVEVVNVEQMGWYIQANIGGANPSLGTSAVSSYTEIADAGLDMVIAPGSASAEIPCSGTNPSTGVTCAAGNESLGVAFIPPSAGKYEVCISVSHNILINSNADADVAFQLVETPNNAQTILQEGGARSSGGFNSGTSQAGDTQRVNICGQFDFGDTGQKTIRLMYEQRISAGTIASSAVLMDRLAAIGQRDAQIVVRRMTEFRTAVKFDKLVSGIEPGINNKICKFKINLNGASCTLPEDDGCIDSLTACGAGVATVNWTTSFWSATDYRVMCMTEEPVASEARSVDFDSKTINAITLENRSSAGALNNDPIECIAIGE